MVEMNLQRALANLQIRGVTTGHTSLSEISAEEADLFVTGKDLAPLMIKYPRVIVLTKLISLRELTEKLRTAFAQESDTFFIE
jgi:PTS system ascorbate-specific IIB component